MAHDLANHRGQEGSLRPNALTDLAVPPEGDDRVPDQARAVGLIAWDR